jgi:hypothetical protein
MRVDDTELTEKQLKVIFAEPKLREAAGWLQYEKSIQVPGGPPNQAVVADVQDQPQLFALRVFSSSGGYSYSLGGVVGALVGIRVRRENPGFTKQGEVDAAAAREFEALEPVLLGAGVRRIDIASQSFPVEEFGEARLAQSQRNMDAPLAVFRP